MNLSKNAMGTLINRYKAILKKNHLLNTFGSLAIATVLAIGSVGVAAASNVTISGNEENLSLGGGSQSEEDRVTTSNENALGSYNLNIDVRSETLDTMTIGSTTLTGGITVILKKGSGTATEITSKSLHVVDDKNNENYTTIYRISDDLTHTVNGEVSFQSANGMDHLEVDGTLKLDTSASGGAVIKGINGFHNELHLDVTRTLAATNGTAETDLNVSHVTLNFTGDNAQVDALNLYVNSSAKLVLDNATVNASNIVLDSTSIFELMGTNTINGSFESNNNINIRGGESLTIDGAYSLTDKGTLKLNNLIINSADLISTGTAPNGQILFNGTDSLLSIGDTLTLNGDNELVGVRIAMKSLEGAASGTNLP